MATDSAESGRFGIAILILMQLASLACVFVSMYLLDDDIALPRDRFGLSLAALEFCFRCL